MSATAIREAAATALPSHLSEPTIRELDRLAALPPKVALRQARALVQRLAGGYATLPVMIMPSVTNPEQANGPQIVHHIAGHDGGWWLGYFLWAPGTTTPIHDHTSWGIYACANGALLEERYRRLDDGTQPEHARLRLHWIQQYGRGDCSELLPYEGGIHRVGNPTDEPARSVHLYGPRQGPLDGRDYDPARDYVCDRWE